MPIPSPSETTAKVTYSLGGATAAGLAVSLAAAGTASPSTEATPEVTKMTQQATPMDPASYIDDRLLDAKLEAVDARTETKFEQLLGEVRVIGERLGSLDSRLGGLDARVGELKADLGVVDGHARTAKTTIIATIIGTGLAAVALAWGAVQIFQSGLSLSAGAFQAGMTAQAEQSHGQSETGN